MLKRTLHYLANINFRLLSLKNVKKTEEHSWLSTDADPQLILKSPYFLKGWYFIELKVDYRSDITQTAKLYPNYGNGYSEETAFAMPHRHYKPTYKVIYLPKRVKSLRFDPVETKTNFSIEHFKIYRIPQIEAKRILLKRISNLHPKFISKTNKEVKDALIQQNKRHWRNNVLSTYEETFSRSSNEDNYQLWIKNTEKKQAQEAKEIIKKLTVTPLISILLPCYNSNPEYLSQCIESVQKQSYKNWQLCIVDDASTRTEHITTIQQFLNADSRIEFQQRTENGHISEASNTCLKKAKGLYTLLLDHDDLLPEHTFLYLVNALQNNQNLQLIYADEDKINDSCQRFEPHFKPEWNPDLLYSQNYIGHPVLYQTTRLKELGGFRKGVEGSQDHDLLLRYTATLDTEQIHRIPKVLYHWRVHSQSTAAKPEAKDYTTQAGIKALQEHFNHQNKNVKVCQGKYPNTYRVRWPVPKLQPLVTLMIPTYNGHEILDTCIKSILDKTTYNNYEILIINNNINCQLTLKVIELAVEKNHHVRVINWHHPFNYSAINNYGAQHAKGTILGLINNDIEVISPDWLTEMVSHVIRPEMGCVGAKLYYSNDTIQHAGVILGIGGVAGHAHKHYRKENAGYFSRLHLIQNLSAVTAACLLVRKEVFEQVDGLEQNNLPIAFNDVDFCIRVKNTGYRNLWTPYAELYHHESVSRGAEDNPEKQKRAQKEVEYMVSKWAKVLANDPAYSPNLTLTHENFSMKPLI